MKLSPFSDEELSGKSVEFQILGRGTAYGLLRTKLLSDGSTKVDLQIKVLVGSESPKPQTLDPKHLMKHPIPTRAEFLWAEDPDHILALIRSDSGIG